MDYLDGSAYLFMPQVGQWQAIGAGTSVTGGTSLSTGPQSQAEIQLGLATLRLGQQTQVDVVRLDPAAVQIQVDQGMTALYLHGQPPPGGLVVATPLGQAVLMRPGIYHIDVAIPPPGTRPGYAEIGVLDGDAQVMAGPGMVRLLPGQKAIFAGQPTALSIVQASPLPMDDWSPHHWRHEMVIAPPMGGRREVVISPSMGGERRPEAPLSHEASKPKTIEGMRPAAAPSPSHEAPHSQPAAAHPPAAVAAATHAPATAPAPHAATPPAKAVHDDKTKDKDKGDHQ